jgi:hypothetical protein
LTRRLRNCPVLSPLDRVDDGDHVAVAAICYPSRGAWKPRKSVVMERLVSVMRGHSCWRANAESCPRCEYAIGVSKPDCSWKVEPGPFNLPVPHIMDKQFFTIVALALISGLSLRRKFSGDIAPKTVNRMAWLFLAVLAAETFSARAPTWTYFLSGLLLLLFVTGIAFLIRGFKNSDSSDYLAIASTTFGGGNRGFALITVVSAWPVFSEDQRKHIIEAFFQMDVMVLAWLMLAVPALLWHKHKNTSVDYVDSIKAVVKDIGAPPLVVMAIVFLSWAFPADVKASVAGFLEPSHAARSALLLYLSLTYVFMVTTLATTSFGQVVVSALVFYTPRWSAAGAAVLILTIATARPGLAAALIPPILVFAVCPPSNGVNSFLESFAVPRERIAEIANVNLLTTVLFVVILLVATIAGPVVAAIVGPLA